MERSVFEVVKAPLGWSVFADNVKIGGVYDSRGAALEAAALAASAEFERVFSEHKQPDEIPTVTIPMTQRKNGKLGVIALLVAAGLAESNGAARRLIQQGAVKIGKTKITDIATELVIPEGCVIQAGKRAFARIVSA